MTQRGYVARPVHTATTPHSATPCVNRAPANPATERKKKLGGAGAGVSERLPSAASGVQGTAAEGRVQRAAGASNHAGATGPDKQYALDGGPRRRGVLLRIMSGSQGPPPGVSPNCRRAETSESHFQEPSETLVAVLNQMLEADCSQRA